MQPIDLLQALHDAGTTVRVNDSQLLIGPADRLTEELRAAVREGKPELLDFLERRTLEELLWGASRVCDLYGDGEQARADMRADVLATPPHLRADLLDHFTALQKLHNSSAGFHQNGGVHVETTLPPTTPESSAHA